MPFSSPKRRIARAKVKLAELERGIDAYIHTRPTQIFRPNPDGTTETHLLWVENPIPIELSDLAVEILDDCRSALDTACYAAAIQSGAAPHSKFTSFPMADTLEGLENAIRGRCKDLPADIIALLRTFKPYQTGNRILWALNQMRNVNQHRVLSECATAGVLPLIHIHRASNVWKIGGEYNPITRELPYLICGVGTKPDYSLTFAVGITLGNPALFGNEAAQIVLTRIISQIEKIVYEIEAESARIVLNYVQPDRQSSE